MSFSPSPLSICFVHATATMPRRDAFVLPKLTWPVRFRQLLARLFRWVLPCGARAIASFPSARASVTTPDGDARVARLHARASRLVQRRRHHDRRRPARPRPPAPLRHARAVARAPRRHARRPTRIPQWARCASCARRPGYEAARAEPLIVVHPNPSLQANRLHAFVARGARLFTRRASTSTRRARRCSSRSARRAPARRRPAGTRARSRGARSRSLARETRMKRDVVWRFRPATAERADMRLAARHGVATVICSEERHGRECAHTSAGPSSSRRREREGGWPKRAQGLS